MSEHNPMTPLADLDGYEGTGGCDYCNADFEVSIKGGGVTVIHVKHDDGCQMIGKSEAVIGEPDVLDTAMRNVLAQRATPNRAQRRANKKQGE
jgi:hypothetical protein